MREQLCSASADWDGTRLHVSTGRVERTWHLVASGLSTVSLCGLRDVDDSREWIRPDRRSDEGSDWRIRGYEPSMEKAEIVDARIYQSAGRNR